MDLTNGLTRRVEDYVKLMLTAPGLKVLLLDNETAGIVGLAVPQSVALSYDVVLFEALANSARKQMLHLHAIVFVRPTKTNIDLLTAELANPLYGEYSLFFSAPVGRDNLAALARADATECVRCVQEVYADYLPLDPALFSLNVPCPVGNDDSTLIRISQGLLSVCASLKCYPVIRCSAASPQAMAVSTELVRILETNRNIFNSPNPEKGISLMLIFDRREDPVTPLLFQWTYQALLHEVFGISRNRIDLSVGTGNGKPGGAAETPGIKNSQAIREAVFSQQNDDFFATNMYKNYGDLGAATQELVQKSASERKHATGDMTVEELRKLMDTIPEARKANSILNRHVSLVFAFGDCVSARNMFEVGQVEQELACHSDHNSAFRNLTEMLENPRVTKYDKVRLAMLYVLRYHSQGRATDVLDMLRRACATEAGGPDDSRFVTKILAYAGPEKRAKENGLFGAGASLWAKAKSTVKKGIKGVENVFTEHKPWVADAIDAALKNKLSTSAFPVRYGDIPAGSSPKIAEVIVFFVGGATYEEAMLIAELNKGSTGTKFVLGGTSIINSKQFLESVDASQ